MDIQSPLLQNILRQMRQDLSNVHFAVSLLVPQDTQDEAKNLQAAMLEQSYYRMLRLVEQLESANRMPASPCKEDTEVSGFTAELCAQVESLAALMGISFRLNDQLGHHLCALDTASTKRILLNLLSNALKFTPAGGEITVTLKALEHQVVWQVADSGCGIAAKRLETLFDLPKAFNPMASPKTGVGLGLPLSYQLAQSQGGRLLARSEEGKGSVFTLSLPDQPFGRYGTVRDVVLPAKSGFDPVLLGLADALPARAFYQQRS